MTIEEMIGLFDDIQDKKNSVYFSDDDKLRFLNEAQIIFLSERIENNFMGGLGVKERGYISDRGIENTIAGADVLRPLTSILRLRQQPSTKIQTDFSGLLRNADIEIAINTETGAGTKMMKMLNMAVEDSNGDEASVRYVRHNDVFPLTKNDFTAPTQDAPFYVIDGEDFQIYPQRPYNVTLTVIREPKKMTYLGFGDSSNVDCELDSAYHSIVLAIALDIAGVSSRDSALLGLKQVLNKQDRDA